MRFHHPIIDGFMPFKPPPWKPPPWTILHYRHFPIILTIAILLGITNTTNNKTISPLDVYPRRIFLSDKHFYTIHFATTTLPSTSITLTRCTRGNTSSYPSTIFCHPFIDGFMPNIFCHPFFDGFMPILFSHPFIDGFIPTTTTTLPTTFTTTTILTLTTTRGDTTSPLRYDGTMRFHHPFIDGRPFINGFLPTTFRHPFIDGFMPMIFRHPFIDGFMPMIFRHPFIDGFISTTTTTTHIITNTIPVADCVISNDTNTTIKQYFSTTNNNNNNIDICSTSPNLGNVIKHRDVCLFFSGHISQQRTTTPSSLQTNMSLHLAPNTNFESTTQSQHE